jgi:subtilisin family serine protease
MGKINILSLIFMICLNPGAFAQQGTSDQANIHPNIIVIKLKTEASPQSRIGNSPESALEIIKNISLFEETEQVFPLQNLTNSRSAAHGLHNIYKLQLAPGTDIWPILLRLRTSGLVEYAEPHYQNELLYVPNDPQAKPVSGKQNYLSVIRAYDAWDIQKSDTSIVIGIVDTGVKMNHEDLKNIAFNYADPINGIDDDGDGFIDNFHGWDIADQDNDPTADNHPHGSPVTGLSSAATNNGIGMAGVGFMSKYLPVKIAQTSTGKLFRDFEGVKYAADQGCKVINLSWGGAGNYSRYGQDVINYAVLEKDAVVIAAAGNTNAELDFYPASFDHVLSVGATDINDKKASWATYSYKIDIMAPGDNVYTTKNDGGYEITTGSSFAAPMVAGAAALVRAQFPQFSAIQVMEQLRVTSDDIYNVGTNMNYFGQLGHGRLNVYRALTDILTPSVRVNELHFQSNHGNLIFAGDTVDVSLVFTNYLRQAENVTVRISNVSENVYWHNDEIYIPSLGTMQSYSNQDRPLTFVVSERVLPGERLLFRVDYLGNYYTDFQYFEIPVTPGYFDISDGNIEVTIASDGDIGFDEGAFRYGNGISFRDKLFAIHAGLIISYDKDHVINNVINDFNDFTRDQDFIAEQSIRLYDNSMADYDARSVFKPKKDISSALPIRIEQKALAWDNLTENGFIIFEYRIINTGDSALTGLNAGLFADWDIDNSELNEVSTDELLKLGYAFDKSGNGLYAGMALISDHTFSHFAIDKKNINGNIADFNSLFTDSIKHEYVSSGLLKTQAGANGSGNDVAQILGAKQFDLQPGEATKVTIAMLASESFQGLKDALALARLNYPSYLENPPLGETFYACAGDSAMIDPVGVIYEFFADLQLTQRLDSGSYFKTPPVSGDTYYFAVNLDSGYRSDVIKFKVSPGNPKAAFKIESDTLLIEKGKSGQLAIDNTSMFATSWSWDFGNGYYSSVEHPFTSYQDTGIYVITLKVSSDYGCEDVLTRELLVAYRPERPVVEDQQICKHSVTHISAGNTDTIRVFADAQLKTLLYQGASFLTGNINRDTLFHVTNYSGGYESLPVIVKIKTLAPVMGLKYVADTSDLENKYVLTISNEKGPSDSLYWFIDGTQVSRGPQFHHVYAAQAFEIMQVKVDAQGCADTLRSIISPMVSSKPPDSQLVVCKNAPFKVEPGNGIFHFYSDQEMTNLVHKGRSYIIEKLNQNTNYYIANADQLLESHPATIAVKIHPVKAIISVESNSILLEEATHVEIVNDSEHALTSFWLYESGTFETAGVLTESFETPGSYSYTLVALGSNGCSDTARIDIKVFNITAVNIPDYGNYKIFPNPVSNEFTIDLNKNTEESNEFEILNISGQRVHHFYIPERQSSATINIHHLPDGLFFIQSLNRADQINFRIIKQ